MAVTPQPLRLDVAGTDPVSALLMLPASAAALLVLAHGAGAGMRHAFMTAVADQLAERNIGTLRYQFPYMEKKSRRPDPPPLCHATVRAAVAEAARCAPGTTLFAGGKSFGGRMTSQAQASSPLPHVAGLIFLGFPLHPDGRPSATRADHLHKVDIPMLFLQGTRDRLADTNLLTGLVADLGSQTTLELIEDADHSFHVPARTGLSDAAVLAAMLDDLVAWIHAIPTGTS